MTRLFHWLEVLHTWRGELSWCINSMPILLSWTDRPWFLQQSSFFIFVDLFIDGVSKRIFDERSPLFGFKLIGVFTPLSYLLLGILMGFTRGGGRWGEGGGRGGGGNTWKWNPMESSGIFWNLLECSRMFGASVKRARHHLPLRRCQSAETHHSSPIASRCSVANSLRFSVW